MLPTTGQTTKRARLWVVYFNSGQKCLQHQDAGVTCVQLLQCCDAALKTHMMGLMYWEIMHTLLNNRQASHWCSLFLCADFWLGAPL